MLVGAAPVGARQFWDEFRFLGYTGSGRWATVVPVPWWHLVDGLCFRSTYSLVWRVCRCWWSWV